MKIYILTDLEGVAMVSRFSQTREEGPQKQAAMRLLTQEVNAAVDGILDVDADAEIVVWDGHGTGGLEGKSIDGYLKRGASKIDNRTISWHSDDLCALSI